RDVAALDIAGFGQAFAQTSDIFCIGLGRARVKNSDGRHRRLLRPRRERPCHRRAAEQRDEVAPGRHSITSSAVASKVEGTSMPRALAVLRLTTSSYLVGACTGSSAGFSPFRMRST